MNIRRLMALAALALLATTTGAVAHHSFSATYFENKTQTIEGTLVQFMFRNPHSFVHIQAPDEKGTMCRWAIEWAAPPTLRLQGVNASTLKVGDRVVVSGNPGRNPADHILRMRSIKRTSDGWEWKQDFR